MKRILPFILLSLVTWTLKAQDTQFSQYFSASLYLNPGFAGVYNDPALFFNHKTQVPATEQQLELTQVSFVFPLKPQGKLEKAIGGVGLMAYSETSGFQGVFKNTGAFLTYAHNLKFGILTSDVVSIGVQAGFENRSINFSGLNWGSQYNPFFGLDETLAGGASEFNSRKGNFVLNAGIMYYYNPERNYLLYSYSAFSGFSATNINRPDRSFSTSYSAKQPILWKYNGGVEMKFDKLFATPSLLFQYYNKNYQFNAGMLVSYAPGADRYRARGPQLLLGSWYRYRDSFIFMTGMNINNITVRGSYDMNSKLFFSEKNVEFGRNSFEISVQYALGGPQSARKISNPLF